LSKRLFDLTLSILGLIILLPPNLIIFLLLKLANGGPVIFIQERVGKNGKNFRMFKFRTMKEGSHKLQVKFKKLNEADGPVFKIRNDPRLTPIGKILFQTGLDEIPQLWNVLKGEMSIVGPRPLPVDEENKLKNVHKVRRLVKPGITSSWVVSGAHSMSFSEWMELDKKYINSGTISDDIKILYKTIIILAKGIIQKFLL